MAWETGTSTGVNDLLSKLSTFLSGAGWTINKDAVSGSGRWLSVQKGADLFVNLVSDPGTSGTNNPGPWIYLVGATGYSGAGVYTAEPGAQPLATFCNKMTGSFTSYYFFEGDDYCHIVVEMEAGRFRHMQFGTLEKTCTFTGGTYVMGTALLYNGNTASNPEGMSNNYPWSSITSTTTRSNYIRANAGDGVQWHSNYQTDTYRHCGMWREINSGAGSEPYRVGYARRLLEATPSTVNGLPVLVAPRALVKKANNLYANLGFPKDLRLVAMDNHQPKDILTIGADQWYLFPWTLRSTTVFDVATDKSAFFGFALRKNTA